MKMSDRYYGTVYLGGKVTQEQVDKCKELLESCLDDELGDDGSGAFIECNESDFADVVAYCKSESIALSLHWEASGDQGSYVEYWIGGAYKFYVADLEGNIAVRMSDLKAHPEMTIAEFIVRMDIPEFPLFEIIESLEQQPA
jgi:hypothetical protein